MAGKFDPLEVKERIPKPSDAFLALRERTLSCDRLSVWGPYTLNLTLEALVLSDSNFGDERGLELALEVKRRREQPPDVEVPYISQPFCCLELTLAQVCQEPAYLEAMTRQTRLWIKEADRDWEGLLLTPSFAGGGAMLIDRLQDYGLRCICAGVYVEDEVLIFEALRQWRGHAEILCDRQTGLWHQGRGWLKEAPMAVSPGLWSRGQAWLVRGWVRALEALSSDHPAAKEIRGWLERILVGLAEVQAPSGLWHRLLHRPPAESLPDSSATGMLVYEVSKAFHKNLISEPVATLWKDCLPRAKEALESCLTQKGEVLLSCPGPGPLDSETDYLGENALNPKDEKHGPPALLLSAGAP